MRRSSHPFRDSVVKQGPSRHRGLEVTVFAPKHGPRFRAYVHTPGWERVLAVSAAESADAAKERAEAVLTPGCGRRRRRKAAGGSPPAAAAIG